MISENTWEWTSRLIDRLDEIMTHPLLDELGSAADLRLFLNHWVYTAWDYMSLLAALRNYLHNPDLPWLPPIRPETAWLVARRLHAAEAVVSDGILRGSVFSLAREALIEAGGSSAELNRFLAEVSTTGDIAFSLEEIGLPETVSEYILTTWDFIADEDLPALAGAFCCGREMINAAVAVRLLRGQSARAISGIPSFAACLDFSGQAQPVEILSAWRPVIAYAINDSREKRDRFCEAAETMMAAHEILWLGIRRDLADSRSSFEI